MDGLRAVHRLINSLLDDGAPGMNRTCDTRFRKPVLYPLSYEGKENNALSFDI